jgi:integrase
MATDLAQHRSTLRRRTRRLDGRPVARKQHLEEGEHSIERVQPSIRVVKGVEVKVLAWRVRPRGYAKPIPMFTQVPKSVSDAKLRQRARDKAAEVLRSHGAGHDWTLASEARDYCRHVVEPAIQGKLGLSGGSKKQYVRALQLLLGECAAHRHHHGLGPLMLRGVSTFRVAESCLQEIARLHGEEASHQARTVLTGYVYERMFRDELSSVRNPLFKARIDTKTMAKAKAEGREGGVALSRKEFNRAVEWLLGYDPAEGAQKPSRGRWGLADVIARPQRARDLTLLQMGTGLRIHEALKMMASDCSVVELDDDDGGVVKNVFMHTLGKGGRERDLCLFEPAVFTVVSDLVASAAPGEYLIGSPSDRSKLWELRNATKAVEGLYLRMHQELGIKAFEHERSHVWRATLNTLHSEIPEAQRADLFGHTVEVNRESYSDLALTPEQVVMLSKGARR